MEQDWRVEENRNLEGLILSVSHSIFRIFWFPTTVFSWFFWSKLPGLPGLLYRRHITSKDWSVQCVCREMKCSPGVVAHMSSPATYFTREIFVISPTTLYPYHLKYISTDMYLIQIHAYLCYIPFLFLPSPSFSPSFLVRESHVYRLQIFLINISLKWSGDRKKSFMLLTLHVSQIYSLFFSPTSLHTLTEYIYVYLREFSI